MMKVKIPDYIATFLNNHFSGKRFNIKKSIEDLETNEKCKKWFDSLTREVGQTITPELVFATFRQGSEYYEPIVCKNCGKLLTPFKISRGLKACSMKCTKALPEVKARASASMKDLKALEKRRQTWLKKYGTTNPMQNASVKKKHRQTCIEKYGTAFVFQSKDFKDKRHQTCLEKYGNAEPFAAEAIKKKALKNAHISRMYNYYDTFIKLLKQKNIETDVTREQYAQHTGDINLKCLRCGTTWVRNKEDELRGFTAQFIGCPKCTRDNTSSKEREVADFIRSLYKGPIKRNDRSILRGRELDIYLPEKNLAIEFDGIYWHSAKMHDTKYHQLKTFLCREQGIRLIHIFEHEWLYKQEKVKNLLRTALGIFDTIVYARQCIIKELSSNEYTEFLELNHLNGAVNSSLRLGLFYKDELVSVIGFGKSRFKRNEIELHRFCNKMGYRVPGGFSKLLAHSNQKHFFSYVDLAHFDGHGYKALGFSLVKATQPSYIYIRRDRVLNRLACQKHKLKKLLGSAYNEELSESDNMALAGWLKVYDCGNLKLEYDESKHS